MTNMLTVAELAVHLRISRKQAYRLAGMPDFPTIRIGKRILIPEDKYEAWLNTYAGQQYLL